MKESKNVLGVVAVKGGVGKTTVALNLGAIMSYKFGKRVLLVDGNFSTPHLGLSLGLVNPQFTLQDALLGKISPFGALYKHRSGMYVLPGALNPRKVNPLSLKNKIAELKDYFDVVIIDSSPSMNEEMLATMNASDALLVVTSPDHLTLSSTMHAVHVAKKKNIPVTGLVINKIRNRNFEISREEIEKTCGVPVLANFEDDNKVLEALSASIPITLYKPNSRISQEYEWLASLLLGEDYKRPGLIEKITEVLKNSFGFKNVRKTSNISGGVENVKS